MIEKGTPIAPAEGRLGILLPGLGAVSTTFIIGVEAIRRGLGQPIGSLTQMGTIRLGKRTEGRSPLIRDFVPLTNLQDIVFGGWDIYEDSVYDAAMKAGVLERPLIESVKDAIEPIRPMKAVFDHEYVKRLDGPNVKKGKTKLDLAEQLMEDIARFRKENNCSRLVMVWCGSTRSSSTRR
jgi:myo-inositol-1-phosphate synthase